MCEFCNKEEVKKDRKFCSRDCYYGWQKMPEMRMKISKTMKEVMNRFDIRKKVGEKTKERHGNQEYKERFRKAQMERWKDLKERKKQSKTVKKYYEEHPKIKEKLSTVRRKYYEEHPEIKEKLSIIGKKIWEDPEVRERRSGENSYNWKGGISNEPYCDVWTDEEYKQDIKERDNYKCQNPGCWGNSKILCLHHINYDKKNCEPDNLITLCNSCNSRANANRVDWEPYYRALVTGQF